MITVVPFEPEHLLGKTPLHSGDLLVQICNNEEYLQMLKATSIAYSGILPNGKIVGSAGVRNITATTYEGWALLTEEAAGQGKSIVKAVELFIQNMFKTGGAGRFQATVNMNFKEGHKFAKILKFKPEGILKNYDQGCDYMMYGRTNTWL